MPGVAFAHGLVQRQQLPIPQWLFAWAAAAVLVISFFALAVLWREPRLEHDDWRPLPGGRGVRRARRCRSCAGAIGVGLLIVTILAGYIGAGTALDNWAPTFILITFWVGMVFLSILFGDVFRAFSPWRAIGRLLPSLNRPYPERLGRWPAAVGLFVFTWIELVQRLGRGPGDARHRGRRLHGADARRAGLLGRRDAGPPAARRSRSTTTCSRGCRSSRPATACSACAGRSAGCRSSTSCPARCAFVAVMIGTVTFDGLSPGAALEGPLGERRRRARRARDRRADRVEDRLDDRAVHRRVLRRRLLPAGDRGRALGRRRAVVPASSSTASCTRWCRSRRSTSPRTT